MLNIFRHRVSPTLVVLLEQIGRGAHKRVDENRELLELLQSKVPHLLDECPWIVACMARAASISRPGRFGALHRQALRAAPRATFSVTAIRLQSLTQLRASLAFRGKPCSLSLPSRLGVPEIPEPAMPDRPGKRRYASSLAFSTPSRSCRTCASN